MVRLKATSASVQVSTADTLRLFGFAWWDVVENKLGHQRVRGLLTNREQRREKNIINDLKQTSCEGSNCI